MFSHNRTFIDSFFKVIFINGNKVTEQNYIAKLHSMITYILVSQFKTFDWKLKTQKAQKDEKLVKLPKDRSSHPEVLCEEGVFRGFAKFAGDRLCRSHFFNKVASMRPVALSKRRLGHRCFPVGIAKFLRTPFLAEHLRWLFL